MGTAIAGEEGGQEEGSGKRGDEAAAGGSGGGLAGMEAKVDALAAQLEGLRALLERQQQQVGGRP